MGRTIWHCHIAASLDGKIARPDGSVDDWLAAEYPAEDFGFDAFFAGVDAILMGRGTYEAVLRFGGWRLAVPRQADDRDDDAAAARPAPRGGGALGRHGRGRRRA